jgi:hypothetical protein
MPSIDDYTFRADGEAPPPPEDRTRVVLWIVLAGLLIAAAIAAAVLLVRSPAPIDERDASKAETPAEAYEASRLPALGSKPEPGELPPLDLTDPLARELLGALSSRPELVAWLATDNLVRHGVAAIDNVARGQTPTSHFRAVAPREKFSVAPRANQFAATPRSYARYDGIAQTIASLDAEGVSSAYGTLRPRLIEAYQELGYPDGEIDRALQRAIVHLLEAPLPPADARIEPAEVMYKYVDPRFEGLSPAQKQLLRMGPDNARLVQRKLREIALALGIPDETLPAASRNQ